MLRMIFVTRFIILLKTEEKIFLSFRLSSYYFLPLQSDTTEIGEELNGIPSRATKSSVRRIYGP